MRVEHLRGFHYERHVPETLTNQAFPNGGSSKKCGESRALSVDTTIREEEESRTFAAAQKGRGKLSKAMASARDSRGGRKSEFDAANRPKKRGQIRELA